MPTPSLDLLSVVTSERAGIEDFERLRKRVSDDAAAKIETALKPVGDQVAALINSALAPFTGNRCGLIVTEKTNLMIGELREELTRMARMQAVARMIDRLADDKAPPHD